MISYSLRLSLFILFMSFLSACASKEKPQTKKNELPNMTLSLADGSQVKAKDLEGKTILVFFQPDCDHCQNEAKQFKEKINEFKEYKVYFASSANMAEILKFGMEYNIINAPNVFFAFTPGQSILDNYGPIAAPSIYVYRDGALVQSFNGEVELDVVIKYL
jgi:hypothetical protein